MAQVHQVCTNGHRVSSYRGVAECPVFVKGKRCEGEMVSAATKRAKEILGQPKPTRRRRQ